MRPLQSILTPAAILDTQKLGQNIDRAIMAADRFNLPIRVHLKTAKSPQVAKLLAGKGIKSFAVSTLAELEAFARAGHQDILYTTAITADKVASLLKAREYGANPKALVDDLEMARQLARETAELSDPLPLIIEIDVDGNRGGVPYPGDQLDALLALIDDAAGLSLAGIMTYSGATYAAGSPEHVQEICDAHCKHLKDLKGRLEDRYNRPMIISSGGSPMGLLTQHLEGLTELRMGVFYFSDLFQSGLGIGSHDDIALSVLTSVLSVQPQYNRFIIDAGGLALSQDRSTSGSVEDWGFGRVCDLNGTPIDDLCVSKVSQEHGIVTSRSGQDPTEFVTPGDKLRILPNHACYTAAAYPGYELVKPDAHGSLWWDRVNGWYI